MDTTPKETHAPLMIYDGDCAYCKRSILSWRKLTGDLVAYAPSQEVAERFPQVPREQFQRSVVFIDHLGEIHTGARAVFRSLAYAPGRGLGWWAYRHVPGFAGVSEAAYRFVAGRREGFALVTRLLWGRQIGPPSHLLTRWVFLRALAIVYLVAFVSLGVQIDGLLGAHGIQPAGEYLARAESVLGESAKWRLPTVFWWNCDDAILRWTCWAGAAVAVLLILRIAPALCLVLLWGMYLSLVVVGGVFLSFQWDVLLLETGLLAIFLAPMRLRPRLDHEPPPSRIALWLLRWLLFRLMFESGMVKLTSGDTTWSALTALNFHYLTQPLPTRLAWYAHQLPEWFQKFSVVVMFVIELVLPFFIFAPRRVRFLAAGGITLLMLLIGLTGNYNFFNLLTVVLCIPLLDDTFLQRFFPGKYAKLIEQPRRVRFAWVRRGALGAIAALMVMVSSIRGIAGTWRDVALPGWTESWLAATDPWRSINAYGLFRVMTTQRREIIIEGSNDGEQWREYAFKWKPGDVNQPPCLVQPHQPRLDWQMWFAALGSYRSPSNAWFIQFLARLAEGRPDVLALLASNPFPDQPPRQLRARIFEYQFTDRKTRAETGAWWTRTELGAYTPVLTRRQ